MLTMKICPLISPEEFQQRLNAELPAGLRIIHASEMALKGRPLPTVFEADRFLISLEDIEKAFSEEEVRERLHQALQKEELVLIQEKKKGVKEVNALDSVERLQVVKMDTSVPFQNGVPSLKELVGADFLIEMEIKKRGGVRPTEILQHILELTPEETGLLRVVKTESLPPLS